MRKRGRGIFRGFVFGGLIGLGLSVSLLGLSTAGLEVKPITEVVFSPAGMVMLAIKGDNRTGQEPFLVRVFPVALMVVFHGLVFACLGALVAMFAHFKRQVTSDKVDTH